MKQLLLIIIILIPTYVYCEPLDINQCDFISDSKSEIFDIFNNIVIYKDTKTKGMLCYGYKDNRTLIMNIPINEGVPDGKVQIFYPNHQMESNYKKGKLDGIAKLYDGNGNLEGEYNYKNGEKEGVARKYYENGKLEYEYNYKNDEREGIAKEYYESGALKMIITYENGKAVRGKCSNDKILNDAELSDYNDGLPVHCD